MTRPWTRVLVCGGRDYGVMPRGVPWERAAQQRADAEVARLRDVLDEHHAPAPRPPASPS